MSAKRKLSEARLTKLIRNIERNPPSWESPMEPALRLSELKSELQRRSEVRYIIEGEWTGYTSAQRRICHREVYKSGRKVSDFVQRIKEIGSIGYTDGTSLILSVREAKPREKVQQILAYCALIRDAVYSDIKGHVTVEQLRKPVPVRPAPPTQESRP